MNFTRRPIALIASLLLAVMLAGCGSSEDRQAKYFDKAQALYDSGDYAKAELELKNVLQINADHPRARYLWALLNERSQNWRQMFRNLLMAVELDPNMVEARIKLGQLYYRAQAFEQALEQADAVLALQAENADAHALRGSVLFRRGDQDGAVEEAQLALAQVPGHVGAVSILTEVYRDDDPDRALAAIGDGIQRQSENAILKLLRISVLEEQGDSEGVVAEYRSLIAEYPENLFYHYRLVKYYEAQDRIDEAEDLLRDIVKTRPENLQLKLWLAEFIANQRNLTLAEATVKEFIQKQPDIYELRFALGKIHTALRQYPEAEQVYLAIIELDQEGADSLQARNQLVKLYLAQNQRDEARVLLDEILAIEQDNTEALITTARLQLAERDAEAAIISLRTVVKNEPTSTEALLLLAAAHEATGAGDLALDNYRNAMAVAPDNKQAVLNLARLQAAREEFEQADQLLQQYLLKHPGDLDSSRLLVESYVKQSRFEDALATAEVLKEDEESRVLALYMQGRVNYSLEEYALAEANFREVLQLEPGAIEALAFLLQCKLAQKQQEEAYKYLVKHVEQYPEQVHALEHLGELERMRGNTDAAIASYEAALSKQPNRTSSMLALAQLQMQAGNIDTGFATYQRAIEANPGNANLMVLTAGQYERRERYLDARELYESALAVDGDNQIAKNNLAMILVEKFPGQDSFSRALDLAHAFENSDQPVFLDTLGWVYYRMENYDQALPIFQDVVKKDESTPVFRYHLGMTYYRLDRSSEAKRELMAALESGADFPEAESARNVLAAL